MSDKLILILGLAGLVFVTRLTGFGLTRYKLPPFGVRFLRFVPISVFMALIAPNLLAHGGEWFIRVVALVGAGVIVWRTRQLWLSILAGMGLFWALRAVLL